LCDRVRLDGEHARPVPEHPLDDRLLARVVEAADVQNYARCMALVWRDVHDASLLIAPH